MAPSCVQSVRKQICSRAGTSANYGEACKVRFYSLRSASFEVVCRRPFAPQICFQMYSIIRNICAMIQVWTTKSIIR